MAPMILSSLNVHHGVNPSCRVLAELIDLLLMKMAEVMGCHFWDDVMKRLGLPSWQCFSPTLSVGLLTLEAHSCHVMRRPMERPTWQETNCHKTSCWKQYYRPCVSTKTPVHDLSQESARFKLNEEGSPLILILWKDMSKRTNHS